MSYMKEPTSFLDFLQDCDGPPPLLIYKTCDMPKCTILEQGSEGGVTLDYVSLEWEWNSTFMFVLTECTEIPERWFNKLANNDRLGLRFDWILVSKDSIKSMIESKEPYACIWNYHKGHAHGANTAEMRTGLQ